jgi:MFS family permease
VRTPGSLEPLAHRGFRLLAGGQLASNIGDAAYAVALPWYVLADHGGALLLGTVLAAYGVPRTALVALGGHASDRWRPWTVMMAADAVRVLAVGALAVLAATGPAHLDLLVPVAAVLGAGEGMFLPASFAIVPSLLPDDQLQAGNALTSGGTQLAILIGPGIGGALVALAGPAPAFGIDALSFIVSAATLAGVRRRQRPTAVSRAVGGIGPDSADPAGCGSVEPSAGTEEQAVAPPPTLRRLIASTRALQVILAVTVAGNLGSGGTSEVALPALARQTFHTSAAGYGGLLAAFGAGALLGSLLAGHTRRARRPAIWVSTAFLAEAGFLAVVPYLGGVLPAAGALAAYGALNGFGNIIAITAFQRWAPPALLGRLMGLLLLASFGVFPASVLLGGLVVHDLGAPVFFLLAAVILAVAVLAGLTQPTWRGFGTDRVPEAESGSEQPRFAPGPGGDRRPPRLGPRPAAADATAAPPAGG